MASPATTATPPPSERPTTTPTLRFSYRTTGTGLITFRGPHPDVKPGSAAAGSAPMFTQEDANATSGAFTRATDLANFVYSPDGRLLAQVIKEKPVAGQKTGSMHESRFVEIYDVSPGTTNSSKPITRIPPNPNTGLFGVEDYIYWSPQSRYLVTWQPLGRVKRTEDGQPAEGNLKIWDVRSGIQLISWIQEDRQGWPVCRWTPNERLLLRLNQGQLHVFDWMQFAAAAQTISPESEPKPGKTATDGFSAIEGTRRETLSAQGISEFSATHGATAVFVPEKKGMPAKVSIFRLNDGTDLNAGNKKKGKPNQPNQPATLDAEDDVDPTANSASAPPPATLIASAEPSAHKSFFKADDVQMVWHNRGLGVLVLASTVMDSSGKSYYGETSLYYLQADGKFDANVTLEKQGPVHSVAWNPKGNDFAVTYGYMPSKTTLFNRKCRPLGHLGTGSRNTLIWSPHGRVLCVGGFGALSGEMDFWDTAKLQKLGTCTAYCSSSHQWSPDGRYLMACVLWPRLRVDNGIKIFNVAGQLVWTTGLMKELVGAQWQPAALEPPQCGQPPQYTYPRGQYNITMPDLYPDVLLDKISLEINAPGGGLTSASTQAPIPGTARENPFGDATSNSPPAPAASAPAKQPAKPPTTAKTTGAYRHPHWSGSTRSAMTNDEEGPSKVVASPLGGTSTVPIPGASKVAPQQQQRNLPVGYVPAANGQGNPGPSKAALRNKAKRERKRQQKLAGGASPTGTQADDDNDDAE